MPANIHPADPNHPKGMAWVLAAGFPDPRPAAVMERQQLVLTQGWEPWSELIWDLGIRWHPELQKKWLSGGGQFSVAEISDEKPETPVTLEDEARQVLDMLEGESPAFVKEIKRISEEGTPEEKAKANSELRSNMQDMMKLIKFMEAQGGS